MLFRKNYKFKNKCGFSLVELIIGLLIFLSSILLLLGAFPISIRAITKGRYVLLATHLAEQKMEYIKSLSYDEIYQGNPNLATVSTTMTSTVDGVESLNEFTEQVSVATVQTGLKQVKVQVSWQENRRVRYVMIESLVHDPE